MPETRGADLAGRLRTATDELLTYAVALPSELVHWKPGENVWTMMDNLCHVAEFIPFWTAQLEHVIADRDYVWGRTHTDKDRLAAVTNTAGRQLSELTGTIRKAANNAADTLAKRSDEELSLEAPSRNPRWGVQPAHFIAEHLLVEHVRKHTCQVWRNAAQYLQQSANYVFAPPAQPSLPVAGQTAEYPVHRVFCVGRNYEAHAREMGVAADREAPFYFTKASVHCVPSGSTVPYPCGTGNYHHEMELVVAIGKAGFRIPEAQALDHVFGYACGLDMTRRDLQTQAKEKQRPWDLGKDVEHSAVAGEIVPVSAAGHPLGGRIELRVNGQTKQSADLSSMIHGVPAIIAHLSQFYHLQPGDLIYSGTPEGVGPVRAGDRLEGSIENVGSISLTIGAAE